MPSIHPEASVAYIKESELSKGAGLRRDSGRRAEEGLALRCLGHWSSSGQALFSH